MFIRVIAIAICIISASIAEEVPSGINAGCVSLTNDLVSLFKIAEVSGKNNQIQYSIEENVEKVDANVVGNSKNSSDQKAEKEGTSVSGTKLGASLSGASLKGASLASVGKPKCKLLLAVADNAQGPVKEGEKTPAPVKEGEKTQTPVKEGNKAQGAVKEDKSSSVNAIIGGDVTLKGDNNVAATKFSSVVIDGNNNKVGRDFTCEASKFVECRIKLTLRVNTTTETKATDAPTETKATDAPTETKATDIPTETKAANAPTEKSTTQSDKSVESKVEVIFEDLSVNMCKPKDCDSDIGETLAKTPDLANMALFKKALEKSETATLDVDMCGTKLSPIVISKASQKKIESHTSSAVGNGAQWLTFVGASVVSLLVNYFN